MSGDKSKKEKISIATNNADSVVVGSDAENNVVIIHSLSNLGGNLLRPDNNIGAMGRGSNQIGVSIAINSFCKQVKLNTPGLEKYKECKTEEDLSALKGTEAGKIDGSNIFILASFMIKSLINAKTNDSLKLIPVVIDVAKKFDNENSGESQLVFEYAEALAIFCGQ